MYKKTLILTYIVLVLLIAGLTKAQANASIKSINYNSELSPTLVHVKGYVSSPCVTHVLPELIPAEGKEDIYMIEFVDVSSHQLCVQVPQQFEYELDIRLLVKKDGHIQIEKDKKYNFLIADADEFIQVSGNQLAGHPPLSSTRLQGEVVYLDADATYGLVTPTGDVFVLKTVNIDLEKYVHQKVILNGLPLHNEPFGFDPFKTKEPLTQLSAFAVSFIQIL